MQKESFILMTYNIFCRSSLLFKDAQDKRAELIPRAIDKFCNSILDCVIIQEIFDESAEKILDKHMKKYGFYYKTKKVAEHTFSNCLCFSKKIIEDGGIKIYSKFPISLDSFIIFKDGINEDKIAGKGVIYAKINKNNKFYHVFGTHLQAGGGAEGDQIRLKQLQQTKQFINNMKIPNHEPCFLGGDLNIDFLSELDIFTQAENILDFSNVNLDMSTFDKKLNEMQIRDAPEQDFDHNSQNLLDHILISDSHLQPLSKHSEYISLKSDEVFYIKKPSGNLPCCGFLKKLSKYSKKKYPMYSLSDHEPIISYFIF